jgi:hypothetical protein
MSDTPPAAVPFTLNVDASLLPDVNTAFQSAYPGKWTAFEEANKAAATPIPDAQMPAAFAVTCVQDYIIEVYTAWHVNKATQEAAAAAQATVQQNAPNIFQ